MKNWKFGICRTKQIRSGFVPHTFVLWENLLTKRDLPPYRQLLVVTLSIDLHCSALSISLCDNSRRLRSFANHPHRMDINWLAPIPHFRLQRHFSFLIFSSPWTFFRYVHDAVKWEMTTDAKGDHQTSFSFVCECVSYFYFSRFGYGWIRANHVAEASKSVWLLLRMEQINR